MATTTLSESAAYTRIRHDRSKRLNSEMPVSTARDALLAVLGDDAFGSIYEHYSGRPRPAERTNGNNTNSREPRQAQKKRREDDDGHEHEDDGDWSVERDFEKATNVVKARRRLVVARDTAGNTTTAGLAALAAHAGATAADGADDRAPRSSSRSPTPSPSPSPLPSSSSPSEDKKKPSAKKRKKTGSSRTRRAASGVLINGKMVHSINGVPDEFLLDMASLPLDKRPKRCGQCGSCQNLHRKKACEVMRALGTNPPIPRGSNREKLLGTANSKKHVPRSFGTADGEAPDVTKLQHRGDEDEFSVEELERLKQALVETHPNMNGYWRRIAIKVRTKGEQACFQRVYQSDAYYKHAHSSKHGATANGNGNGSGNGNGNGNGARRRASGEADAGSDIGRLLERRFGERAAAAGRNGDAVDAGVDVNAGVDHRRVRDLVEQELLDEGGDEGETTDSFTDSEF